MLTQYNKKGGDIVNKGYKYKIIPTKEQQILINKTFGCCRFVYNQILGKSIEHYEESKTSLKKFNLETELKQEYEWLKEVDSVALQQSRIDLQTAYKNFFRKIKQNTKEKGFPKFKSKRNNVQSYRTQNINNSIRIDNNFVKIPKLGWIKIKLHRQLPINAVIKSATISCKNNKYTISLLLEYEQNTEKIIPQTFLGLDYSQKELYVDSENRKANYPHFYRVMENKLSREQKNYLR